MKFAKLLHNPGAGEGDIEKDELLSIIEAAGYECSYSSTKKNRWEKIESEELDFIIVAGGDGTVRKVAKKLLNQPLLNKKLPLAVLPMGTANNIARTLGIVQRKPHTVVPTWNEASRKNYDVGKVTGLSHTTFFLESIGYGVFPKLMEEMEKQSKASISTPEKSLNTALKVLHNLIQSYKAKFCKITIDGIVHSGKYLLVEVMNTSSIGPNLQLAPMADPGDGFLEVVLIGEHQRNEFAAHVLHRLEGKEDGSTLFHAVKAKSLTIYWEGNYVHVDDEIIKLQSHKQVAVELLQNMLEFIVPADGNAANLLI